MKGTFKKNPPKPLCKVAPPSLMASVKIFKDVYISREKHKTNALNVSIYKKNK